jgi:hypothetical protein
MRQQHLFTPLQSTFDRQKYIFKPSFLRIYSLISVIIILFYMVGEIIYPTISTAPAKNIPLLILAYSLFLLVLLPLSILVPLRSIKIVVNKTGVIRTGLWHRPIYIDWDDIILAKSGRFKTECILHIKSVTSASKTIELSSWLYDLSKILIIIKKFAGNDRPLTIALEKEVLLPRQNLAIMLWRIIIGIIIILSIWLIGGNLYADYREKPLNEAIANYVHQHPKIAPNQAAIDLQSSIAKLGLSVENFGDGSKVKVSPTPSAIVEWKSIEPIVNKYINERLENKSSEPLPVQLSSYLITHRSDLETIKGQLIDLDLPEWGADTRWIDRNDIKAGDSVMFTYTNFLSLLQIQKLLITNIFSEPQLSYVNSSKDLEAIIKLNRSFQSQTLIFGQLVNLISTHNTYKLTRLFDALPAGWEQTVVHPDRVKMMCAAIEHQSMSLAKTIQDPKLLKMVIGDNSSISWFGKYQHLARPYTRILAVSYHNTMQQRLAYWDKQNVCLTDGKDGISDSIDSFDTNKFALPYPKALISNLDRELTIGVRKIKSQLQSGGAIETIANEFKLASKTCPGEHWTARVKDGVISISLSHQPNWGAIWMNSPDNLDRLTYKIQP